MSEGSTGADGPFRVAGPEDAVGLRNLERDTNLVALGHVFPPTEFPFPEQQVLDRWRATLAEEGCTVLVADGEGGRLDCYVAYDDHVVRHLAVRPDAWRRGLGRAALARAASEMADPTLWCLDLNFNAHRFYARLGWERTGRTKAGEWPPYPAMSEWAPRR